MEEDDDVVLEGSSLYNHLQDVGYTDFEVATSNNANISSHLMMDMNKEETIKGCRANLSYIKSILGIDKIEEVCLKHVSMKLLQTKILDDDDLLILENLSPSFERLSEACPSENSDIKEELKVYEFWPGFCISYKEWCVVAVCSLFMYSVYPSMPLYAVLGIFITAYVTYILRCIIKWKFLSSMKQLGEYLNLLQNMNQLSLKTLKFLNEVSFIKRGLIQREVSTEFMDCYESSLSKELSDLFHAFFTVVKLKRSVLIGYKSHNCNIIHSLFAKKYDLQDPYRKENGLLYTSLKAQKENITRMVSACLTETFLLYERSRNLSVFDMASPQRRKMIESKIQSLDNMLKLCRKKWLRQDSDWKEFSAASVTGSGPKLKTLYSIDAFVNRCKILTGCAIDLQNRIECNGTNCIEYSSYESIKNICNNMKTEIIECSACLDDILDKAEDERQKSDEEKTRATASSQSCRRFEVVEAQPLPALAKKRIILELEEPLFEDEVFEATTNYEQMKKEVNLDEDYMWVDSVRKERQLKEKQKARCQRVLKEIAPILRKRREMWQEREDKALNRKRLNLGNEPTQDTPDPEILDRNHSFNSGINSGIKLLLDNGNNEKGDTVSEPQSLLLNQKSRKVLSEDTHWGGCEDDSEEERLLLYRKVKKELDEDEAMRGEFGIDSETDCDEGGGGYTHNSGQKRLKEIEGPRKYKAIDSEEERVLNYRNVKFDLNENEAFGGSRGTDSDVESENSDELSLNKKMVFTLAFWRKKVFPSCPYKDDTNYSDSLDSEISESFYLNSKTIWNKADEHPCTNRLYSESRNTRSKLEKDEEGNYLLGPLFSERKTYNSDSSEESPAPPVKWTHQKLSKSNDDISCGESSDDTDSKKGIDWKTEMLYRRKCELTQFDTHGPLRNLSAVVKESVHTRRPDAGAEEVFGGFGEGESDDSQAVDESLESD